MNRYFVIGNPIGHSLSPQIHNYWFKKYRLNTSNYEKRKLEENELEKFVREIRDESQCINGANVTVPYKKKIIPFLDKLSHTSLPTQSVNTIFKKDGKLVGHNTDTTAFEETVKQFFRLQRKTYTINRRRRCCSFSSFCFVQACWKIRKNLFNE